MTDQENPEEKLVVGRDQVISIIGAAIVKGVLRGRFDKKDVIVKRVEIVGDLDVRELEHLRSFSHENIVQYLYNDSDTQFLYIVLEKCDCTLAEFVDDSQKKNELCHLDVLWQIIKGMIYLHEEKDTIHRDLKPSNVLMLFRDSHWVVKIADFGISKKLQSDQSKVIQSAVKGTEGYMAPEQIKGCNIGKYADIYSLGLVFHYVLSEGMHPFGAHTLEAQLNMHDENATPDLNSVKDEYKHDAESLILAMIAYNEKDRVCIKEVQAHHLFWNCKKKLNFYQDVSDYIISPQTRFDEMRPIFDAKLEEIADDWRQSIRDASSIVGAVFDDKRTRNKKQGDGICDLLRNIRNVRHHYGEKELEFQEAIGCMPEGYYQFFKRLFPKLLNHVYEIMKRFKEDEIFVDYYTHREQEHLRQKSASGETMQSATSMSSVTGDSPHKNVEVPDKETKSSAMETSEAIFQESSPNDAGTSVSSDIIRTSAVPTAAGDPAPDVPTNNKSVPEKTPGTGITRGKWKLHPVGDVLMLRTHCIIFGSGFEVMAVENRETSPEEAGISAASAIIQKSTVATEVGDNPASDVSISKGGANMSVPETTLSSNTGLRQDADVMAVDEQKSKLVLRDYQWELAQQALKGENSLIVAPTGSGKTAVLTEVIKQHLETHQDNGRVMFMVPKTALARQQYWYLKRCLEGCSIDYMIGQFAESAPVGQRILANQVTVLTPQILINELKKDSDRRYVSFTDLTMFVFDECHNATKSHPYRELMDMLLDFKSIEPDHQIQVVGVTASPGVGKAKDRIKVQEKLIELLGNLNVMAAPSTVEKNLEELARHHSKIKEYFLQIETEKQFASEVEIVVGDIENTISVKLKENQIESVYTTLTLIDCLTRNPSINSSILSTHGEKRSGHVMY